MTLAEAVVGCLAYIAYLFAFKDYQRWWHGLAPTMFFAGVFWVLLLIYKALP